MLKRNQAPLLLLRAPLAQEAARDSLHRTRSAAEARLQGSGPGIAKLCLKAKRPEDRGTTSFAEHSFTQVLRDPVSGRI